jgi:hypothetical protein
MQSAGKSPPVARALALALALVGSFALTMDGYRITPVLVFWTFRVRHWVKFTFETGFELPSSWAALPGYGPNMNRNILDFMK